MATKSTKKAASKKAAKSTPKPPTRPAAQAKPPTKPAAPAKAAPPPVERDARLPRPGGVLTRTFQGKEIKVQVLDAGFGYEGKTWRSLSAIAKAVTGTSWNGFLFFGLQTRAKQPTDAAPAAKDGAK